MFGRNHLSEIDGLIAKKKYGKAAKLLRDRLVGDPESTFLRAQLADVLAKSGEKGEAMEILNALAEEFAKGGFTTKAIAMLKKMQRIRPGLPSIEKRIAGLIKDRQGAQQPAYRVEEQAASPAPDVIEISGDDNDVVFTDGQVSSAQTEHGQAPTPRSPLFADFSSEELVAVIQGLILHTYAPGEIVVSEGEPGLSMFVLSSGLLRVYVRNARGHNNQVRMLDSGSFFGEISLITQEPRSATVVAAEPCELLELDKDALFQISRKHPNVPRIIHDFYQKRQGSPEERRARS